MKRKGRFLTLTVVLLLALCGGKCGGTGGSDSGSTSGNGGSGATAVAADYEKFIATLAENGWEIPGDSKAAGSVKGVASPASPANANCEVRFAVTKAEPLTYKVTSVNGFPPDYFGNEAENTLGRDNMTHDDFFTQLRRLNDLHVIDHC